MLLAVRGVGGVSPFSCLPPRAGQGGAAAAVGRRGWSLRRLSAPLAAARSRGRAAAVAPRRPSPREKFATSPRLRAVAAARVPWAAETLREPRARGNDFAYGCVSREFDQAPLSRRETGKAAHPARLVSRYVRWCCATMGAARAGNRAGDAIKFAWNSCASQNEL